MAKSENNLRAVLKDTADAITAQDEWCQTHNTNADRIKQYGANNRKYWEMSAYSDTSNSLCVVNDAGGSGDSSNYNYRSVPLVFAL